MAISVLPTSQAQPTPTMSIREAIASKYLPVNVEYQSVTTVVLRGDECMISTNGTLKPFWVAIDIVKHYGYSLDEIITSGMGSEGNPTRFYAVMSKP